MTYYDAAVRARTLLTAAGILPETATLDAGLLARHVLGWDLATWLTRRNEHANAAFGEQYAELIRRRASREPVAYIRGVQEFWGREFVVTRDVLIPRPETELLVELALPHIKGRRRRIVDVGTGSGCIAITLALECPDAVVYAVDISPQALAVAAVNARRHGVETRVCFIEGDLLAQVPPPLDLIVSNPPYVAERDRTALAHEVRDYEPAVALFGGDDGWRAIQRLLDAAPRSLAPGGLLLVELGCGQSESLCDYLPACSPLSIADIAADLQGIARVAVLRHA